jgi:site-specific DNA-methyltransferase (adenine-specific)
MQIVIKNINQIFPYEKNPRKNDEAVKYVANSIKEFGFKVPIVIDAEGIIVAGHTRYKAAKKLGIDEVPCIVADDLTNEQIKAFRLADNKVAEQAEWDIDLLNDELELLLDFDMGDFGFDDEEEDADDVEAEEDDFEPEPPEEPKAKQGDIYQLGEHRLMCGDSTNADDVEALMAGDAADILITDPPYNVDYEGKTKDKLKIENDSMNDDTFRQFLVDAFTNADGAMKEGAVFYIWHADSEGYNFRGACRDAGWKVRQCLIWNKNSFVMGRQDYHWKHEPCLYGWKDGAAHYFIDDRTQATVYEDKGIDLKKMKKDEMQQLLKKLLSDKQSTTVINEDRPSASSMHPTMKPIKLIARLLRNSSRQEELVLDLFGGSGSTLMACEQLNRKCYTMEYDPRYVDVIIQRWEEFTGRKAELINGNN